MRWETEFDERLKVRYQRLYGVRDCEARLKRDKKGLALKAAAALGLLLVILCFHLLASFGAGDEIHINERGEIVEITRPSADQEAISFSAEVEAHAENGIIKREYYITIEPSGKEKSQQSGTPGSPLEQSPESQIEAELRNMISKLNADTSSKKVRLPKELKSGGKLVWTKGNDSDTSLYFIAFAIVLFLLYKTRFYKVEQEERKARASIIRELPEFINKLLLRLNAGSVLTTAFMDTVEDSVHSSKGNTYFYQQMDQIARSVKEANGVLHQELREFSRRSGVNELIRITNIINDNISKGVDFSEKLKKENELLWFSRKQHAEEQGRLAETKLTIPLMILLLVLIMITIAPALMGI